MTDYEQPWPANPMGGEVSAERLSEHTADIPAEWRALYDSLPDTLPAQEVLAANARNGDLHTVRTYSYNGWDFEVPPGVHMPGGASAVILDRLLDGTIGVTGKTYAVVGSGLGVEAVIAGSHGAADTYAMDVHPASVQATAQHYERIVGEQPGTRLHPMTSDLFERFPDSKQVDVVTFNAPAINVRISDDPDMIRILCVGTDIVERFFRQIAQHDLLAPGGEIFVLASNTTDLKRILKHAIDWGFSPGIAHVRTREGSNLRTYLFRFHRDDMT